MIKLYIFESVKDARAFEREPDTVSVVTPFDFEEIVKASAEEKPHRKYKKRNKVSVKKARKEPKRIFGGKYDPDHIAALAKRVEAGEITSDEAAAELGVSKSSWYSLKYKYGKESVPRHETARADDRTEEDIAAAIRGLKEDGFDSIQIAQRLKISLKKVNEYW